MNLRDLHYFLAVAETLHFKRAADICHVSQPTLSMQIKKTEDYLGVRLFERTNKAVALTPVGARIAELARRMVLDEKQIREIAHAARNPETGEFRLGAFPTLASYVFPCVVSGLRKTFPCMHFLLVEDKTDVLVKKLNEGKIDAALLALPEDAPFLKSAALFDDPFYLAVGRDHPLAAKKSARVEDLKGNRLLLLDEGHCLRDQALAICKAHGAQEENSFRATSLETLRLMVQTPQSGFMTLMPEIALSARDKLVCIPFRGAKVSRTIGLVWRKADAREKLMAKMAQALQAAKKAARA